MLVEWYLLDKEEKNAQGNLEKHKIRELEAEYRQKFAEGMAPTLLSRGSRALLPFAASARTLSYSFLRVQGRYKAGGNIVHDRHGPGKAH